MKGKKTRRRPNTRNSGLANATYYGALTISCLAGFIAYSSGASMEGTLTRVVITLLACTVLGYAVNIILWVSATGPKPSTVPGAGEDQGVTGTRIDLVAGDDAPAGNAP